MNSVAGYHGTNRLTNNKQLIVYVICWSWHWFFYGCSDYHEAKGRWCAETILLQNLYVWSIWIIA